MIFPKNIFSITTVKKNLKRLVDQVHEEQEPLVITRDGQAAAMLISVEEYEGWLETIDILKDPKILKEIKKAEKDFKKGHFYTHEEVFGK